MNEPQDADAPCVEGAGGEATHRHALEPKGAEDSSNDPIGLCRGLARDRDRHSQRDPEHEESAHRERDPPSGEPNEDRPEQVELLFYSQGPQMQQGF